MRKLVESEIRVGGGIIDKRYAIVIPLAWEEGEPSLVYPV
jgi:hypothetical protein